MNESETPKMDAIEMEVQTLMRDSRHASAFNLLKRAGYDLEKENNQLKAKLAKARKVIRVKDEVLKGILNNRARLPN